MVASDQLNLPAIDNFNHNSIDLKVMSRGFKTVAVFESPR